jgi:Icc-related predicted phosphoesterase
MFFGTDVHGSEIVWRKWLAVPTTYQVDVMVMAGDLTGKMVIPIIKKADGSYVCRAFGQRFTASTEPELEQIMEKILFSGYYPRISSETEVAELKNDPKKVDEMFEEEMAKNMERWMRLVAEKIPENVKAIVMPGNDDSFVIDGHIRESRRVIYPLGKTIPLFFDYEMISMDYSNPTPWDSPRECSEQELRKKLEETAKRVVAPWNKVVCNFHVPPFGTGLDLAPELDENLQVVADPVGGIRSKPVGSTAVAEFMKEHQPFLGLHGHIHESAGNSKIGNTLLFNPGSEYGEGILRGIIFEFTPAGIDKFWSISG